MRILFAVVIFIVARPVVGQQSIMVVPSLGLHTPLSYSIDNQNTDSKFRPNTFHVDPSFSLSLLYQHSEDWRFSLGWRAASDAGISARYGDFYKDLVRGRLSIGSYASRFQAGVERKMVLVKALKTKRRAEILRNVKEPDPGLRYGILFNLYGMAGLSYNTFARHTGDGMEENFSNGTYVYHLIKENNASIYAGTTLQFLNYGKQRFIIKVYYSQGLKKVLENEITFQLASGDYWGTIGSRGSFFAIEIGYPIRIKSF